MTPTIRCHAGLARAAGALCLSAIATLAGVGCSSTQSASAAGPLPFEVLGVATLPSVHPMTGNPVGGLSGLSYDPVAQSWLVVSDRQPEPIAYTLRTSFDPRTESEGRAWVVGAFEAWLGREWPVPPVATDTEGVAVRRTASDVHQRIWVYEREPAIAIEDMRSGTVRSLEIPQDIADHYQFNLAFECAAIVPDRRGDQIWVGLEAPLTIDQRRADPEAPPISRVLVYHADSGELLRTLGYAAEPLDEGWQAPEEGAQGLNTLVGLSTLPDQEPHDPKLLLALERAFRPGDGNRALVFALDGDTREIDGFPFPVLNKHLAFDFADLDLSPWGVANIDNVEGIAIGPRIADRRGGRLVLVVVDDNFGRFGQTQYVYALRVQFGR